MNLNATREFLRGKKTYGVAVVGFGYLLGVWAGWFAWDEKVLTGLGLGFFVTFRSALNGIVPKMEAVQRDGEEGNTEATEQKKSEVFRTHLSLMVFLGLAGLLAAGATGCAVLEKAATGVTRPAVSTVTNTVVEVRTNFIPIRVDVPVQGRTEYVTNIVEKLLTNTVERVSTVTNYVAKEGIAEGLQTAKAGAAVAGVFNPGAGAIASAGLGVLSGVLGFLVRRKNNEAINAREEAASLATQLQAVVEGVEKVGGVLTEADAKAVKETISKVSSALGVAPELHASVKAITS